MRFDLSNMVSTESQARLLLDYIDTINNSLYMVNEQGFEQLLNEFPADEVQVLLNAEIKTLPKDQIKDYLLKLSEVVKSMKIIRLDMAVRLPDEMLQTIHKWLIENVTPGLLMRISVNPDLVAGVVITYEGRYLDLTLRKKLEKLLNENKTAYVR